jgi:hypothetical protein
MFGLAFSTLKSTSTTLKRDFIIFHHVWFSFLKLILASKSNSKCVFGFAVAKIEFGRIEFDIIDFS